MLPDASLRLDIFYGLCLYLLLLQEDHLEQIKLARSKASNLLVPDDYDGSTYHAKLSRTIAEVKRATEVRFPDCCLDCFGGCCW